MKLSANTRHGARLNAATQAPGHGAAGVMTAVTGWLVLYGVAVGATAGATGGTVLVRSGLFLLLGVAGVVVAASAAHLSVGAARVFWSVVTACAGLWCAGHLGADLTAAVPSMGWPAWWRQVCDLVAFVPAMVAALFIVDRPSLPNELRGLLDLVVIGAASSYFVYQGGCGRCCPPTSPGTSSSMRYTRCWARCARWWRCPSVSARATGSGVPGCWSPSSW